MNYAIEIVPNPAGYSEGTYGYIVRDNLTGDACACDGGYCSREHAMERAREIVRMRRWREEEGAL